MTFIVFLSGLLLHSLLIHWTESVDNQKANCTTLAQIIDFFDQNYSNKSDPEPFAVAINVPWNQCQGNFGPSNFPNATHVKNAIYNDPNKFYNVDKDLKAAGSSIGKSHCKYKPVTRLFQNDAAFTRLLESRNDGCVVIYTVYSPCQNMTGICNITPALEALKNHSGIKAFVIKKVCGDNENDHICSGIALNCTEIEKYVPLYRFVNKTVIYQINTSTSVGQACPGCPSIMNKFSNI